MTSYCKLCDKANSLKTKYKHFKSKKHKYLEDSFITRSKVENPDITQLNEIMHIYTDIHNTKYNLYQTLCVLKVNDIQYFTCKPMLNLDCITYPYLSIENQPFTSQVLELRDLLISSYRHMT